MAKKVCIVSPSVYPILAGSNEIQHGGGAEAQLSVLGQGLAENDYEVHYVVGDFGQPDEERLGKFLVHKAPLRYMGGSNWYLLPDWFNYVRVLWHIDADYHIIKLPRNLLVPLGAFCRFRNRRLLFIGQIDNDVDLEYIRNNEGFVTYWLYRIGIKSVDFIVAQNEKQREGFARLFGKTTRTVKSVITLPDIRAEGKGDYILWVGSSLRKKQPRVFLELARALPNLQFRMIVAPVDVALDQELRAEAAGLENLEYLGFVPFAKIGRYFSESAIFASTSLLEGFPNTFLQSWQFGTPVVSLNVDPDDVIQKHALGRLSGTFEKMCSDVRDLMGDSSLREKLGENGRQYVRENHSREVVVPQYLDILEHL